jgi:hypothetical protein
MTGFLQVRIAFHQLFDTWLQLSVLHSCKVLTRLLCDGLALSFLQEGVDVFRLRSAVKGHVLLWLWCLVHDLLLGGFPGIASVSQEVASETLFDLLLKLHKGLPRFWTYSFSSELGGVVSESVGLCLAESLEWLFILTHVSKVKFLHLWVYVLFFIAVYFTNCHWVMSLLLFCPIVLSIGLRPALERFSFIRLEFFIKSYLEFN